MCTVLKRPLLRAMRGHSKKRHLHALLKANFKELKCYVISKMYPTSAQIEPNNKNSEKCITLLLLLVILSNFRIHIKIDLTKNDIKCIEYYKSFSGLNIHSNRFSNL